MAVTTPTSLRRFCRETLPLLLRHCHGGRTLQRAKEVVATDRWNSFDRFRLTTKTLVNQYEEAGAAVDVESIPTGGRIDSGRWLIHEAEDVRTATVDITHPFKERLLDYADNPWHAVQWTAATPREGITGTLTVMDSEDELRRQPAGSLEGKTVLTSMGSRDAYSRLAAKGAAVVIVDTPVPNNPNAVPWVKFGWGGVAPAAGPTRLVGLAVSQRQGERLRRLLRKQGDLTVRTRVDASKYVGSHDMVSGRIMGKVMPEDEVWVFAHSGEPGAIDNASGVAVCLELAAVIEELIRRGKIARPRRTIRLLSGYECYGIFAYLERVQRLEKPLAGLVVDTVGSKPAVCNGRIGLHATIPMSAGFVNQVGAGIVRQTLRRHNPGYRFYEGEFKSTADTLIGDPQYGFPCPWLTNHHPRPGTAWDAYHSSADVPALLSTGGLKTCAAVVAGYTYFLANANTRDVLEFTRSETERAVFQLRAARTHERVDFIRAGHRANLSQLQRWLLEGERREIMGRLNECERQVADAASSVVARTSVRARRKTSREGKSGKIARKVPRRLAPITPDMHNTPPAIWEKITASGLNAWTLFWADGTRSLGEIAALAAEEAAAAGKGGTVLIDRVADYFSAHAELGYVELVEPEQMVTRARLIADFSKLGLRKGMDVMVHSSLSSIGKVAGGAETVVDALVASVGASGTLMLPSFNHGMAAVYNDLTTPCTNGAIPDAGWRRPDAVRSDHPTHAVAAIGRRAGDYCRDHMANGIWAADSPIGRLVHGDGYILSLGVTHDTSTAYHIAEMSIPCGCLDAFANPYRVLDGKGQAVDVSGLAWRAGLCPVALERMDRTLDRRCLQRHGKIGAAESTLVRAKDLYDVRREHIRNVCPSCTIAPDIKD